MRLLTNSRMKDARLCPRLHHLRYGLGYRPAVEAEALRFGSLCHVGLEAWWRAYALGGEAQAWLDAAILAVGSEEADPFDMVRAEVMLAGYHARWKEQKYEVLGVEMEFETELRNPETGRPSQTWRLSGKLDVLVKDSEGRVLIAEHKTTSEQVGAGSEYWRRLRLDGQVSTYYAGAASMGHEVAGCLYDVLKKPGQRPLQVNSRRTVPETPEEFRARLVEAVATEPDAYYQRGMVVRLEEEVRDAQFDAWQTAQSIREAEVAGRAPRNPDACVRFGYTCPFFAVCTGEASLDDASLYVRSANVNPELSVQRSSNEGPKEEATP